MARLVRRRDGATFSLSDETVVGRSRAADLRLEDTSVSALHASVHFGAAGWKVRDLGSRNGTQINGKPVAKGSSRPLRLEDALAFGEGHEVWILRDGGSPEPLARNDAGDVAMGCDGMLPLPSASDPLITVLWNPDSGWHLEDPEAKASRPVEDRETVRVGGATWTLRLPEGLLETQPTARWDLTTAALTLRPPTPSAAALLRVEQRGAVASYELGSTAAFFALLIHARLQSPEGWLDRSQVLRTLGVNGSHLNVLVFRLRRLFTDAGFADAAHIVERQRTRMRLGSSHVHIDE
ncbi:MAG: FHA domain-containing protein [Myxococcota bacterium]